MSRHPVLLGFLLLAACGGESTAPPDSGPGEAAQLLRVQGDQQFSFPAMAVPLDPTVMVADISGRGVPGVLVRFAAVGGGWVTETDVITDSAGRASTAYYLSPDPEADNIIQVFSPVGGTGYRAYANPFAPGEKYVSRTGLVEFSRGDVPLILTAPHGGDVRPAALPARTVGTHTRDEGTAELVADLAAQFRATGTTPFTLVSRLHRDRMDPDAPVAEGAEGRQLGQEAWREYHGLLAAARYYIQDEFQRGLLIDVHGHDAAEDRVQLGYLLSQTEISQPDPALNSAAVLGRSSIRQLAVDNQSAFSLIVRGGQSLGSLLEERGVAATPSAAQPAPPEPYTPGSYTTASYGSRSPGQHVSAIYVDAPAALRASAAGRSAFAAAFATALNEYYMSFYGGASLMR